jgi:hypothetical protein
MTGVELPEVSRVNGDEAGNDLSALEAAIYR